MNPENNPYPIDYLNQIAPAPQKPGINKQAAILVIGGIIAILAVVIGIVMYMASAASGPTVAMQTLNLRMQALQKVADSSHATIKSSQLRSVNSNLKIFLSSANRDIAAPLAANNVDTKKIDKALVAKHNTTELTANLEEARLNVRFDDTYAREMSYQLETIAILMKDIYQQSKSDSMKEFLVETDTNLQPIKLQFESFNSTAR